jgi:hypothetical protein
LPTGTGSAATVEAPDGLSTPQVSSTSKPLPPNISAASGVPSALPAFEDVIKGATPNKGYLPIWTRDDKTWIEIPTQLWGQAFFMGTSLAQGLGQHYFWPGLMHFDKVVSFRRIGNNVQLLALNLETQAPTARPLQRALAESYSESLLAAAPLVAALHPQRQSALIDATALLGGDITGLQTRLETVYRMPYSLDRANSHITRTKNDEANTSVTVRSHYAVPKLPVIRPSSGPVPADSQPNPPTIVPDARSLFLTLVYTFSPLPQEPMRARRADQRVGYFTESYWNLDEDNGIDRRTHVIRRWRLEKQDPQSNLSDPKKPIRVVMDKNIPLKWRGALKEGVLEWNKAFEEAGFKNALVVEQQSDDSDESTLEGVGILALRWFSSEAEQTAAVGPSQADPITGEILRAAAIIPENWARLGRLRVRDTQPRIQANSITGWGTHDHTAEQCTYAAEALEGVSTAYELMVLRGLIDPQGPEAEKFIYQSLKDVTMHEVGHALGLRHNFKGSVGISREQLRNSEFTSAHGISNSVMDYNGLNLTLEDEKMADIHMNRLGAYDKWAIAWGYREYAAEDEARELAILASQSDTNSALAYATDEDTITSDPLVNRFDLGDDPLEYAKRQIQLARELWQRTTQRPLDANDDMSIYRRNLQRVLNTYQAAASLLAKHMGATLTSRQLAGSKKPVFEPLSIARQRQALSSLIEHFFNSQSFRFEPEILSRLGLDQFDRTFSYQPASNKDFNLMQSILQIQRTVFDALISEALANRLADSENLVTPPVQTLSYVEVQQSLLNSVWVEVFNPPLMASNLQTIDSLRRQLQREYLRRVVGNLVRPSASSTTEAMAVNRQVARRLQTQLQSAIHKNKWDTLSQYHLEDALNTLSESLNASLLRTAP